MCLSPCLGLVRLSMPHRYKNVLKIRSEATILCVCSVQWQLKVAEAAVWHEFSSFKVHTINSFIYFACSDINVSNVDI